MPTGNEDSLSLVFWFCLEDGSESDSQENTEYIEAKAKKKKIGGTKNLRRDLRERNKARHPKSVFQSKEGL